MTGLRMRIRSDGAGETAVLARAIGARLRAGDVLLLSGPVGAGKTHFARALIQGLLPEPEDVPSPTYTLVQTYDGPDCDLVHADLYRLGSVDEIEELGLAEAFETAICLIEWPDRLGGLAPDRALHLEFDSGAGDDTREITIRAGDRAWAARLGDLADV